MAFRDLGLRVSAPCTVDDRDDFEKVTWTVLGSVSLSVNWDKPHTECGTGMHSVPRPLPSQRRAP